jgi:hypothetical protein
LAKVIPVIHFEDHKQALRNARLAFRLGADGVFLIHMSCHDLELDEPAQAIKAEFPERFVGTNRLSMDPQTAIRRDFALGLDGTWADRCGINTDRMGDTASIIAALKEVRTHNPDFAFFGSVAFKGQRRENDPAQAALLAHHCGFIATTSGPGTGIPADFEKLDSMRRALGDNPLAIASGVDPDNVAAHLRYVTHILVATGISKSFHEFDEDKLERLIGIVRENHFHA